MPADIGICIYVLDISGLKGSSSRDSPLEVLCIFVVSVEYIVKYSLFVSLDLIFCNVL